MTADLLDALKWHETHANHGRGRLTGRTAKLAKTGYLKITATGVYTWTATITDKGRSALAKAATASA